jgi:hypothetical protein
MIATTHPVTSVVEAAMYVACELSKREWKLAMTSGFGVAPIIRTVASGDLRAVTRVVTEGRQRLGVPAAAPVKSCYEAGRDGFWIHRALTTLGFQNRVVDSSSIEVNRRARRAKTDRIDARSLGVSQPAGGRRAPRLHADAVRQRDHRARAGDQSGGQCAVAGRQHSTGVAMGPLATRQSADAVVSDALQHGPTGPSDGLSR